MRYFLTVYFFFIWFVATSGQRQEEELSPLNVDIKDRIQCMADSIAIDAAIQINRIVSAPKVVYIKIEDVPALINEPHRSWIWYYRIIKRDTLYDHFKIK